MTATNLECSPAKPIQSSTEEAARTCDQCCGWSRNSNFGRRESKFCGSDSNGGKFAGSGSRTTGCMKLKNICTTRLPRNTYLLNGNPNYRLPAPPSGFFWLRLSQIAWGSCPTALLETQLVIRNSTANFTSSNYASLLIFTSHRSQRTRLVIG